MITKYPGFPTQATQANYPLCVSFDYTTVIHLLLVTRITLGREAIYK